jgi:2-alkyl-3-oxoalkanoate reductase
MRVLVAGASGAIGAPLVAELISRGHNVTAIARSTARTEGIAQLGASIVLADLLNAASAERIVADSHADVVIDQLTSLPRTPADIPKSLAGHVKVCLEGGGNLYRAARAAGIRRYIQQSGAFFLEPGAGLATESDLFVSGAGGNIAISADMYRSIEARLFSSPAIEAVALRYGFFYGPRTWYHPDGATANQVRNAEFPIVGEGAGVWSFVHVEDAAVATANALDGPVGIFNVVDSDPLPVSEWLPQFCAWVSAPPPPRISLDQAFAAGGSDALYYGTKIRGASNKKAQSELGFRPRSLEWLRQA